MQTSGSMLAGLKDIYLFTSNASALTLLIAIGAIIGIIVRSCVKYRINCGPWGIPLFGFYPFLRKDFHIHLTEMVKKYGDAYLLSMCGKRYLHIGSHDVLREAFVTKAEYFSERIPDIGVLQHLFGGGVNFLNGESWRVWHKFLLQSMRELQMVPKGKLNGPILNSLEATMNTLRQSGGQPIDIETVLAFQIVKANGQFLLGENVSNHTTLKLMEVYKSANSLIPKKPMLLCGNLARCLILYWLKDFRSLLQAKKNYVSILNDIINEHRRDFDPNYPKDFIDLYLKEKEGREKEGDPHAKYFNDTMFMDSLVLFYGESGMSVGKFIAAYLKNIAKRIDVQNSIYEEIVREIGTERLPTYQDKNKLPFTSSVLKEIERVSATFPAEPTRVSTYDVKIGNVIVPKGTICIANTYAIHHDPTVYENPENFDPRRFMSNDQNKYCPPKTPVTFGIGKRACAGEVLIKVELFIFIAAIMQNFVLYPEETKDLQTNIGTNNVTATSKLRIFAVPRKDALLKS